MKKIGPMWTALPKEKKEEYNERAKTWTSSGSDGSSGDEAPVSSQVAIPPPVASPAVALQVAPQTVPVLVAKPKAKVTSK